MNDRYAYPAKSRLTRPEDVEDLGALPDFLKARTTDQPAASTPEPVPDNPVRGLARKRTAPPPASTPHTPTEPAPEHVEPAGDGPTPTRARNLHRPSSANLPIELVVALGRNRELTGMSAGDTIVAAILKHMEELPALLVEPQTSPAPATGFSPRPVKTEATGLTKLLAFRLTETDFDYLDRLVIQLGARDRTHLIREALSAYLKE